MYNNTMVRSTYKNKHFKKRNNQTVKLRGGATTVRARSKCPYCTSTFAHSTGVYPHCANHHPDRPPPNSEQIRSCSIAIPSSGTAVQDSLPAFSFGHDGSDLVGQRMASSAASGAFAVSRAAVDSDRRQRLLQMQPHPFVVPAASIAKVARDPARVPDPTAIASMVAAASDKYPLPPDIFYDNIFTIDMMFDPVIACGDGYTYERHAILSWFNAGKTTSPTTGAPMLNTDLVPNMSLRSAIGQWANDAAIARSARAVQGRVRAAIVAATAPPSTKGRPATY